MVRVWWLLSAWLVLARWFAGAWSVVGQRLGDVIEQRRHTLFAAPVMSPTRFVGPFQLTAYPPPIPVPGPCLNSRSGSALGVSCYAYLGCAQKVSMLKPKCRFAAGHWQMRPQLFSLQLAQWLSQSYSDVLNCGGVSFAPPCWPCGCGEIGRRAGFRFQ